jgi:hypothetical protein
MALLLACQGQDLLELEEDARGRLMWVIKALLPARSYRKWLDFRPSRVWTFPREGKRHLYVLFEVDNTRPHPGSTGIRVTLFDGSGNVLSEVAFTTGYRCYLQGVKLEATGNGPPLILLETGGLGPNFARQYYAFQGTRIDLVRLEGRAGAAVRNWYSPAGPNVGPALPSQSEQAWEADLHSLNRWRVLRALVWLGGWHEIKPVKKPDNLREGVDEGQLARAVRQRPRVIARVNELTGSEDRWLREAALLVLKPDDQ